MTARTFVIATDPRWSERVPATAWRRNLAGGLSARGATTEICTAEELAQRVVAGPAPSGLVLESPSALELVAHAPAWRVNVWLPVFPNAPHDWPEAAGWVDLVRACADSVTGFLTDSEISRDEIEAALPDRRVEVVVLPVGVQAQRGGGVPAAVTDDDEPDPQLAGLVDLANVPAAFHRGHRWSFAGSKVLAPEDFAVERATWDFNEHAWPGRAMEEPRLADAQAFGAGLERLLSTAPTGSSPIPTAVLGPQLTFIDQLATELTRRRSVHVEMDQWPYLSGPGGGNERTPALLETSDVVIAEWARPNGKWIQEHAADHHRLIVRAHRYEVTTDFPRKLDMHRYFAGVCITPWVGRTLVQEFGWPAEKMVFIPNYVDGAHFARPKLPGAEFTLGMVGMRPALKRLDLALDLLEELRKVDARYSLRVRGPLPPGRPNWDHDDLRQQWGRSLHRIRENALLRGAVFFDGEGRDMARWFRHVGVVLSLSDLEGSHVALAEGVASGAVPVARAWPGITTLWPEEIVTPSLEDAVQRVLDARSSRIREQWHRRLGALAQLDGGRVASAWERLIAGDRAGAQAHFGPVDWQAAPMTPVPAVLSSDPVPLATAGDVSTGIVPDRGIGG